MIKLRNPSFMYKDHGLNELCLQLYGVTYSSKPHHALIIWIIPKVKTQEIDELK